MKKIRLWAFWTVAALALVFISIFWIRYDSVKKKEGHNQVTNYERGPMMPEGRKVICIVGSGKRHGNTWTVASSILSPDVPVIHLKDYKIAPYDGDHPVQDDYIPLMKELLNYDVWVLATPVYWYSVSANLHIFLERFYDLVTSEKELGRQLKGKHVLVLATFGSQAPQAAFQMRLQSVCEYMKMHYHGCFAFSSKGKLEEEIIQKKELVWEKIKSILKQ